MAWGRHREQFFDHQGARTKGGGWRELHKGGGGTVVEDLIKSILEKNRKKNKKKFYFCLLRREPWKGVL